MEKGQPLNPVGPCLDIVGCRITQPRLLAFRQLDLHFGCQDQGDLVLHGEDVADVAVVTLGPTGAGGRIDQLRGDTHPIAGAADTAFQHVADAQVVADLADVTERPL